jgi:hypothetical protein
MIFADAPRYRRMFTSHFTTPKPELKPQLNWTEKSATKAATCSRESHWTLLNALISIFSCSVFIFIRLVELLEQVYSNIK